ncbi:MAG: hypothetical protein HRT67_07850 [Flavobacteriaceae bacterium]|nr:hypothetical protein [Flavobacteriaceae bacterium]
MKKNLLIIPFIVALIFTSCEDDSKINYNGDFELGAVLTTVEEGDNVFNLFDPENSTLSVTVEFNDFKNNDSMSKVDIYVDYIDTSLDNNNEVQEYDEVLIGTMTSADFSETSAAGRPQGTYSVIGQDILDAVGVPSTALNGGDVALIRFELHLNDGRIFTNTNTGTNVANTSHLTPFRYSSSLVCLFDNDSFFTGSYLLEQISGNDPFYPQYGQSFGTQTVNIVANSTERSFDFAYFPDVFGSDYKFTMNIVCGKLEMSTDSNSGTLGCGDGTIQGTHDEDNPVYVDVNGSDDSFDLYFKDFVNDAGCQTGSVDMVLRLTRQ